MALASAMRGSLVPRERVVVIGDSGRTDIGVNGFDALFVTSGIHAQELGGPPAYPRRLEAIIR
jgi:ribonucleotide monophosphatase NagD (HAD superfamily)